MINRNAQMIATIRSDEKKPIRKFAQREEMYSAVNEGLGGVSISYLEFGVWKGESLKIWTAINTDPRSRFYGFDSFEGLPEVWKHGFGSATGKEKFDVGGTMPSGLDARVKLVKGWFQHTLGTFLNETELPHPIVVHIDSDLHSSALYVLSSLDRLLRAGDIIMFDEYASPSNEYLAWEEYKSAFMRKANCIAMSDGWNQAAFALA
jgi:O-methyltransferase